MEKRIKKMQRRGGEVGVARDENIEEIVRKVAELVKKNKGKEVIRDVEGEVKNEIEQEVRRIIEEKKRGDKIIIKGLNTDTRSRNIKDVAGEFLEQEFEVKEKVKSIYMINRICSVYHIYKNNKLVLYSNISNKYYIDLKIVYRLTNDINN